MGPAYLHRWVKRTRGCLMAMIYYEQVTHPPYRTGHGLKIQYRRPIMPKSIWELDLSHPMFHFYFSGKKNGSMWVMSEVMNCFKTVLQDHPARHGQYLEFSDEEKFFRDYEWRAVQCLRQITHFQCLGQGIFSSHDPGYGLMAGTYYFYLVILIQQIIPISSVYYMYFRHINKLV